jgi:hypothetical protein
MMDKKVLSLMMKQDFLGNQDIISKQITLAVRRIYTFFVVTRIAKMEMRAN